MAAIDSAARDLGAALMGICRPGLAHEEDSLYVVTDLGGTAIGWPTM
jgi:hypothetical protein